MLSPIRNMKALLLTVLLGCTLFLFVCSGESKSTPRGSFHRFGALADRAYLRESTIEKLESEKPLNRREQREVDKAEFVAFRNMRMLGYNEVTNTEKSIMMRNYHLRNIKRRGSLSRIFFSDASPQEYQTMEKVSIYANLVNSKKTQIPYEFYDLPGCPYQVESGNQKKRRERKNLGARLQGHDMKPAPFLVDTLEDKPCTVMCRIKLEGKKLRWTKFLIERQYRVQLQLDGLPVLMRSAEFNYAIHGYPVGFRHDDDSDVYDDYLYNHLKFAITYVDIEGRDGIHITGFDVHPVSINHIIPDSGSGASSTCVGMDVENHPSNYLSLTSHIGHSVDVIFSYDVTWIRNENLLWADRWDVYFLATPDDTGRYYVIANWLVFVLFLTGMIATTLTRALRRDIARYNKSEESEEETGWKALHGDVFRPPQFSPMLLSVVVGTGAQIGLSFGLVSVLVAVKLANPMEKGALLTSLIVLYALCGSVAGYLSSRIYKYCSGRSSDWKSNAMVTAIALPGIFGSMFIVLNIALGFVGAATAVGITTILTLILLWVTISMPMVFLGAYIGLNKVSAIKVPTETNEVARVVLIKDSRRYWNEVHSMVHHSHHSIFLWFWRFGEGIMLFLAFLGELYFIMSALWLDTSYYYLRELLWAVLLLVGACCAQYSMYSCYQQLCLEDHRWWWKSFADGSMAGIYMFLYSIWFLSNHLDLNDTLSVAVYMTYMSMLSVCFGLFCGSVGFLSSLWFTRTLYGVAVSKSLL